MLCDSALGGKNRFLWHHIIRLIWRQDIIRHQNLWPPKPSAGFIEKLGELVFYPPFLSNPELLRNCIMTSFETRVGDRRFLSLRHNDTIQTSDLQRQLDRDEAPWDFFGLVDHVTPFVSSFKSPRKSWFILGSDLVNTKTAWDNFIAESYLTFPSSLDLEPIIKQHQRQLKLYANSLPRVYSRNAYISDLQVRSSDKKQQDLVLSSHLLKRERNRMLVEIARYYWFGIVIRWIGTILEVVKEGFGWMIDCHHGTLATESL